MTNCLKCAESKKVDPYCYHDVSEKLGLEIFASFNDPEASYSFDQFSIWQRKSDGALFYGTDSGCSCPSPFEDVHSLADLTAITNDSFNAFVSSFESYCKHTSDDKDAYGSYRYVPADKEQETIAKVKAALVSPAPSQP